MRRWGDRPDRTPRELPDRIPESFPRHTDSKRRRCGARGGTRIVPFISSRPAISSIDVVEEARQSKAERGYPPWRSARFASGTLLPRFSLMLTGGGGLFARIARQGWEERIRAMLLRCLRSPSPYSHSVGGVIDLQSLPKCL